MAQGQAGCRGEDREVPAQLGLDLGLVAEDVAAAPFGAALLAGAGRTHRLRTMPFDRALELLEMRSHADLDKTCIILRSNS